MTGEPVRRGEGCALRPRHIFPDLHQHSVGLFVELLITAHDPGAVEVCTLARVRVTDPVTEHILRLPCHWRDLAGLASAEAAVFDSACSPI